MKKLRDISINREWYLNYYRKSKVRKLNNSDEQEFKKKVFISYARKDKDIVQSYLEAGENRDFELWIDQGDKKPGTDWRQTIRDKINECDGAILFITKNALNPKSPIRIEEIPQFIKRNNDKEDNFQFFPVFLDYVDPKVVENYTFKREGTDQEVKLFDRYDIWNPEANNPDDLEHEMPIEMSNFKREQFWSDLNIQMSKALRGSKITKIISPNYFNSNKAKAKEDRKNRLLRIAGLVFATLISGLVVLNTVNILNPQNEQQTSEVFNIGGSVRLGVLTKGDCFNIIDQEVELNWNSYVQYRACDLLHDGEVYYRENQLDFGNNNVSYASLLNLFSETCNNEFNFYIEAKTLPDNYDLNFYWDMDSQALGTKPFDMLCLTLSEGQSSGSYVEEITGVGVVLPNPGDKYNCEDFSSNQDAQTWYELYFDEYGDVALLDINNNGIVCDEIVSSSNEAVEKNTNSVPTTTTSTTTTSTTTTIPPPTTTLFVPESNVYENKLIQYDEISFNVSDVIKDSPNKKAITSFFNIDKTVESWNPGVNLRIENHWRNGVYVRWNGCEWMGCMYKLSINGVNVGSHLFEGTYYTPNTNLYIGGLSSDRSYQIKLEPIDAMYQAYTPSYISFSGNDWTNDDAFNPGWPMVYEIEGYQIYADQSSWIPPKANKDPIISISDRGSEYVFNLIEWDIEFKKFSIGYTHCLIFVDDQLIGIMGNGTPNYYPLDKSWITGGTLVGKTITLIAYDSPVMPGAAYSFKFSN